MRKEHQPARRLSRFVLDPWGLHIERRGSCECDIAAT
jgi:hypothetical protein